MDPQLTTILQTITETNRALAWHASLQTYLLIGLAAFTVVGLWAIGRDLHALGSTAREIGQILERIEASTARIAEMTREVLRRTS